MALTYALHSVAHEYSKNASSPAKDGQLSQERKRVNDAVHEARLIVFSKWCAATTCHIQHLQLLATWAWKNLPAVSVQAPPTHM